MTVRVDHLWLHIDRDAEPGYLDGRALLITSPLRALRLKKCSCMMTVDFAMSR